MIYGLEILPDWLFLENEIVSGSYTLTRQTVRPVLAWMPVAINPLGSKRFPSEQKPDRVKKNRGANDFVLADPFYILMISCR